MRSGEDRLDVTSADGVRIAVWAGGSGPPLVLVHGSIADHTTFDAFVPSLRPHFTSFALDRRGFGDSSDSPPYSIEREFADVAAVVDVVAAREGEPVAVFAHSFGANCALGAATLTTAIAKLILYEPSFGLRYPPGVIAEVERAIAAGDRDGAIGIVLAEILGLAPAEIEQFRRNPLWPRRLAAAATIPRECHVEEEWTPPPGLFASVTADVLLLSGAESVPEIVEATNRARSWLPAARVHVLHGHAHLAHRTDPDMVAGIIRDFVAS
jgi:pimeloyl-ACP methyl ester carboxylesterase